MLNVIFLFLFLILKSFQQINYLYITLTLFHSIEFVPFCCEGEATGYMIMFAVSALCCKKPLSLLNPM